ncbi:FGGY family carbohydrate kinase [Brevibacterium paucivorans]|uniref:FGGY family carbohydrate kinase n=1 Tax=Brevibacterium paucivorans TaxID=170994 RepID=UPI003570ADE7
MFAEDGRTVASASTEFTQSFPQPGWVEHDAQEIWLTSSQVIGAALGHARRFRL